MLPDSIPPYPFIVAKRSFISWPAFLFLIVFLAIIGIMIGPFEAMEVLEKSKKLQTANDARGLKQAIQAFNSEYLRFPEVGTPGGETRTDGEAGTKLLTILLGKEALSDSMQNKKQIAFFNAKVNKNKNKGGLVYSSGGSGARPEGLYDAWGNPFYIKIDTEYDGELEDPLKQGNIIRKSVIAYSYGADKKLGGGDDVQTW